MTTLEQTITVTATRNAGHLQHNLYVLLHSTTLHSVNEFSARAALYQMATSAHLTQTRLHPDMKQDKCVGVLPGESVDIKVEQQACDCDRMCDLILLTTGVGRA